MVRFLLIAALCLMGFPAKSGDVANELVGTWKMTSWVIQIIGGDTREPFGPNPKGRLIITPNGTLTAIGTGANRKPATNDDERLALFNSLLAYSGRYTIDGDKIITSIDISSNEVFSGANQNQMRFFRLEGQKLTLRTPEQDSGAIPGKKIVATITWEREP